MKDDLIYHFISIARMKSYNGFSEYEENLKYSKEAYIPLSILEVTLRNALDQFLTNKIGKMWYESNVLTKDSQRKIEEAKQVLKRRKEKMTKEKIIAELPFGFWVNLFKRPYAKIFRIVDIKKVFPNLPLKEDLFVTRDMMYKKLDHIRRLRNRIFHHEKVINHKYKDAILEIYKLLKYFDDDIYKFAKKVNDV